MALQKLKELFGINKLLLEGGSYLNNSFFHADLIDELSLVVAPVTAKYTDKPLFQFGSFGKFELINSKVYDGGIVWLNYKKK